MITIAVLTVIAAYLIGSINFAVIFSNAFLKKDVRKLGSGNAGATNVMRVAGVLPGLLTFLCDVLKGFASSLLGKLVFDYILKETDASWAAPIYGAFICGVACMLGHVFPIFFQFKGGKGVATSVGIYAVCSPLVIVIGLSVFIIIVLLSKMVSLGSIFATLTVVILTAVFPDQSAWIVPQVASGVIMGLIVILKHTDNIKRLLSGTESKLNTRRH